MSVQWVLAQGVGQRGGTRRKVILKDTARSPTFLPGLVIVFRTCDTIADDIANAKADTKTPSSMICWRQAARGEEGERRESRGRRRKKDGSRNVNEIQYKCHWPLTLRMQVILFFRRYFNDDGISSAIYMVYLAYFCSLI